MLQGTVAWPYGAHDAVAGLHVATALRFHTAQRPLWLKEEHYGKETFPRYAPRATSWWGTPRAPAAPPAMPACRWLFSFGGVTPCVDRVHKFPLYGAPCFMVHRSSSFVALW